MKGQLEALKKEEREYKEKVNREPLHCMLKPLSSVLWVHCVDLCPLLQVETSAAELDKLQKAHQNIQTQISQVCPFNTQCFRDL